MLGPAECCADDDDDGGGNGSGDGSRRWKERKREKERTQEGRRESPAQRGPVRRCMVDLETRSPQGETRGPKRRPRRIGRNSCESRLFLSRMLAIARALPRSFFSPFPSLSLVLNFFFAYQGNRVSDPYFLPQESPDFPRSAPVQIRLDNVLDWCKRRWKQDEIIIHQWIHVTLKYIGQNYKKDACTLIFRFLKKTFEYISEHFRSSNAGTQSAESTHLTVITCVFIFSYQSV